MSIDDPLLTGPQTAGRLGIKPGTWRAYVHRRQAPPPDDPDLDTPVNRRLPRWRTSTIDRWDDARRTQAWRKDAATIDAGQTRPYPNRGEPTVTTADRRRRRTFERTPETAHIAIRAEVMAYDDDFQRQRLRTAANTEAMVDEIQALWLANPAGHTNGIRGYVHRWLRANYHRWCDRHHTDTEE